MFLAVSVHRESSLLVQKPYVKLRSFFQKIEDKCSGECLGNHGCNCSTPDSKRKDEDENWIENAVCHRADGNGCHAGHGISLRVDKRIHTGGDHGRKCADQIDHQVWIGINKCGL